MTIYVTLGSVVLGTVFTIYFPPEVISANEDEAPIDESPEKQKKVPTRHTQASPRRTLFFEDLEEDCVLSLSTSRL